MEAQNARGSEILNVRVVDLSILHNIAESRLTGRPPEAVSAVRAHPSHRTPRYFRATPVACTVKGPFFIKTYTRDLYDV